MRQINVPWRGTKQLDSDTILKKTIDIVFDREKGSPFWLEFQQKKKLDIVEEIKTEKDLVKLGSPEEVTQSITYALQNYPISYFVPKCMMKDKSRLMLSVTGGTTGPEKTVAFDKKNLFYDFGHMGAYFLKLHNFTYQSDGYNLLYAGPTGNHYVGKSINRMAESTNGLFFTIDMDTRIFKKYVMEKKYEEIEIYLQHIMEQILQILNTKKIDCLVTTSRILEELFKYIDVSKLNLKMIMNSGTATSPDTLKILTEEVYKDSIFFGAYGNAMFGPAFEIPRKKGDYNMRYYSNYPYIQMQVIKDENSFETVKYGETGKVMMRRYTPECFIPFYVERDIAERIAGTEEYGILWDGIMNPRLDSSIAENIIEGIY